MINEIFLKFGESPESRPLKIISEPITVFVGPNNSGKSLILSELANATYTVLTSENKIIDKVTYDLTFDFENFLTTDEKNRLLGDSYGSWSITRGQTESQLGSPAYRELKISIENNIPAYVQAFVRHFAIMLNGPSRLQLIEGQEIGNLTEEYGTTFKRLFKNDVKRLELRASLFDAFKKYFIINTTAIPNKFQAYLSDVPPKSLDFEYSIGPEAIDFQNKAIPVNKFSDGVKAFTGMLINIIAGDPKIIIIDEPEAFLHPPLAFKLGRELGKRAKEELKRVFASTHSANFLLGCIQSGVPITIVRLTYNNGIGSARQLSSERINNLMKRPLLRSTGVLNALFYDFVIVTESDADRAFYQEINERLLMFSPGRGIQNCLFINAQNKQTIHEILGPLRELGIPCVGVVDVDMVDSREAWRDLFAAAATPKTTIASMNIARDQVYKKLKETDDYKKHGGINLLDGSLKEACSDLFDQAEQYGIFIIRHGELENWLIKHGPIYGKGPSWLINAFEKMGDNPNHPNYIKPGNDDIWEFFDRIKVWFDNPNRKGIPKAEAQVQRVQEELDGPSSLRAI